MTIEDIQIGQRFNYPTLNVDYTKVRPFYIEFAKKGLLFNAINISLTGHIYFTRFTMANNLRVIK